MTTLLGILEAPALALFWVAVGAGGVFAYFGLTAIPYFGGRKFGVLGAARRSSLEPDGEQVSPTDAVEHPEIRSDAVRRSRQLRLGDLANVWLGLVAVETVCIAWSLHFSWAWAPPLLAASVICAYRYWMHLRRRGVAHAEVYGIVAWLVPCAAWSIMHVRYLGSFAWESRYYAGTPLPEYGWDSILGGPEHTTIALVVAVASLATALVLCRLHIRWLPPLGIASMSLVYVSVFWLTVPAGFLYSGLAIALIGRGLTNEVLRLGRPTETSLGRTKRTDWLRLAGSDSVARFVLFAMIAGALVGVLARRATDPVAFVWFLCAAGAVCLVGMATYVFARRIDRDRSPGRWAALAMLGTLTGMSAADTLVWIISDWQVWLPSIRIQLVMLFIQTAGLGAWVVHLIAKMVEDGEFRQYGAAVLGLAWVAILPLTLSMGTQAEDSFQWALQWNEAQWLSTTFAAALVLTVMWRVFGAGDGDGRGRSGMVA